MDFEENVIVVISYFKCFILSLKAFILSQLEMFWLFMYTSAFILLLNIIFIPFVVIIARECFKRKRKRQEKDCDEVTLAFFHPYCNAGGGGERVLWCAIRAIQNRYPKVKIIVYTGDLNASPSEIINRAFTRFNIKFPRDIEFVYLHGRKWLEAKRYPYFTILGQSIGSVILGIEALCSLLPDVFIDSMGYAFTLPLFSYIGGCSTGCYVHYPTITPDMLKRVSSGTISHNNRALVARSPVFSFAKLYYYRIFAWIYGICGKFADIVMVNSSWTEEHINTLWKCPLSTHRVYPPCDTLSFKSLPLEPDIGEGGPIKIISVGQYRPEKDHPLQLKAMYELRQIVPENIWERIKLIFIGSCRDSEDHLRVKDMMDLCKHLSLENNVQFKINVSFDDLRKELSSSMIGLHAMWNEHFGIGVVECMAAGHIMVAHKSGGPKADIIEESEGSKNGFLASDEVEYAQAIATIIRMNPQARIRMREAARASVDRFSTEEFEKGFLRTIGPLLSMPRKSK